MGDQTYNDKDPATSALADDVGQAGDETASDQADASSAGAGVVQPDEALEALQREKDDLKDRLLRTAAEFQNYRNRAERERRDLLESAAADVLLELLAILDNFERALQAPSSAESDGFRKGVELIHKQMLDLLRKRGVTPIDAVGADFDPRVHQAVIHEASDEHREGEVIQELQRGFKLGDRLLRPAMVKVAKRS